ncbi:MAG: DNA-directed RNA polymerase subunit delta [Bacilli bacterium]|nr:DNA-directed RNA polymerase subunit delta [Bacilli bacterium]
MKIKDMPIEELELMSLTDLTYMILKENKKSMSTSIIFKEICNLLDYSDEQYTSKIGDYYTSLNIDKRFVLLDNNEWDIRDNHSVELVMDEEDEEEIEEDEKEEEEIEETEEENIDEILEDDDLDDDLEELSIIDEEDEEE